MFNAFKDHIAQSFPYIKDAAVIIACSGGMDSVVLAHLGRVCGWNMALAHCNFNLRGSESDADAVFVQNLSRSWSLPFFLKSMETEKEAEHNHGSIQMLAREFRYAWFEKLLEETSYDFVLTAHHLDDSLETFLINLVRGTGLNGLTGIPEVRNTILRPLLNFSREELSSYAKRNQLKWREDSSNATTKYTRNAIRHSLVPRIKELHPQFLDNFSKTQGYLKESASILEDRKLELQKTLFKKEAAGIKIEVAALKKLQPLKAYIPFLFKEFGFTEWNNVQQLTATLSGKEVYSETHRLIRHREFLLLVERTTKDDRQYCIDKEETLFEGPVSIAIQEVPEIGNLNSNIIYVDTQRLKFPLLLRKWKTGDYFYPFGLQGKKKLSKYFKDEKMSTLQREGQWILFSGDEVVWVLAKRADRRFRVENNTKSITKLELIT